MIKIVHYIPTIRKHDIVSDELQEIVDAMGKVADVRLAVGKDSYKTITKSLTPDIVHVHSCWDFHSARIVEKAHKRGIATVVSTHGGLIPYTLKHEQPMEKHAKMALYQARCLRNADAIVLSTQEEADNIKAHKWQKCTETVPCCLLNSNVSTQQVVRQLIALYGKVIDTRYRLYISKDEQAAIKRLVHAGCSQPQFTANTTEEQLRQMQSLTQEQWKRILLYAEDEHIDDIIDKGCAAYHISKPAIDPKKIVRFPTGVRKNDGIEYTEEIAKKKPSLKRKIERQTQNNETAIRRIACLVANTDMHIKSGTVSMRHLTALFRMLQGEDYDEDKLVRLLSSVGLKSSLRRILLILHDDLSIPEGFLPTDTLEDRKAQAVRKMLNLR